MRYSLPPSAAGSQPMPASWDKPNSSPEGRWSSISGVTGSAPCGPRARERTSYSEASLESRMWSGIQPDGIVSQDFRLARLLVVGHREGELGGSVMISDVGVFHAGPSATASAHGHSKGAKRILVLHTVVAIVVHGAHQRYLEGEVFEQSDGEDIVDVEIAAAVVIVAPRNTARYLPRVHVCRLAVWARGLNAVCVPWVAVAVVAAHGIREVRAPVVLRKALQVDVLNNIGV